MFPFQSLNFLYLLLFCTDCLEKKICFYQIEPDKIEVYYSLNRSGFQGSR